MRKIWFRLGAGAIVILAGIGFIAAGSGKNDSTFRVKRGEFTVEVSIGGNLEAIDSSPVGPPAIGGIYNFKVSMLAPEGVEIEKGAPVVAFDTTELLQKLRARQAEVKSSAKQIEKKEIDILKTLRDEELQRAEAEARLRRARLKTSAPSNLVSGIETHQTELELQRAELELESLNRHIEAARKAAHAELEGLRAELRKAEADVHRIEAAIGKMTRKAPRAGVVTYVADWRGEKVKVGDTVWVSEHVIEIPDLQRMKAGGEIEEALAGRLEVGQKVSIILDAHPDRRFSGRIRGISRTVRPKSWRKPLRIVGIEISLDETDPESMRPGMHFRGSVVVKRLPDVLKIPIGAIRTGGGKTFVLRKTLWGTRQKEVRPGIRNDREVVILDGLDEGDRIVAEAPR